MNDQEYEQFRKKLRAAIPLLRRPELGRDLWPDMLARMNEPRMRVPWYDWVLLGAAGVGACFFPGLIPALLYHL